MLLACSAAEAARLAAPHAAAWAQAAAALRHEAIVTAYLRAPGATLDEPMCALPPPGPHDDALHAPAPRTAFLRAWQAQPDSHSLGIVEDGELVASGTIRACREGHKIGPLHADSEAAADALFRALCARVPAGDTVYLDLPEPNAAARALAARHDLQPVFETARMYAGGALALPLQRIYGITSFELG